MPPMFFPFLDILISYYNFDDVIGFFSASHGWFVYLYICVFVYLYKIKMYMYLCAALQNW